MRHDLNPAFMQRADGFVVNGGRITPVDPPRGPVVRGLQPEFDPDGLLFVQLREQGDRFGRQAVRSRRDRQRVDVRARDCPGKQLPQRRQRRVGIRKALEIGDIPAVFPGFRSDFFLCRKELFVKAVSAPGEVPRAAGRAEDASATPAVPSRLGQVKPQSSDSRYIFLPKRSLIARSNVLIYTLSASFPVIGLYYHTAFRPQSQTALLY